MRTYRPFSGVKSLTAFIVELKNNEQALKLFDFPCEGFILNDIKLPEFAPCKGIQGNPRQFWILNSTPWIPDSSTGFQS